MKILQTLVQLKNYSFKIDWKLNFLVMFGFQIENNRKTFEHSRKQKFLKFNGILKYNEVIYFDQISWMISPAKES